MAVQWVKWQINENNKVFDQDIVIDLFHTLMFPHDDDVKVSYNQNVATIHSHVYN